MRIVIDMQGAQSTGSRQRGIGRYTMALTLAIARNRGDHQVILVLNGAFKDSIDAIQSEFQTILPKDCFRLWFPVVPSSQIDHQNDWNRRTSEEIHQAFIANLRPDAVLYTSLFEGLIDDAVSSIPAVGWGGVTAVILYDLIPLIHQAKYLSSPVVKEWYDGKLEHLKRADLQLAISESSRQESVVHLGTHPEHVANISSAVDARFRPQTVPPAKAAELRSRYGLRASFVMYTGGIDYRKNIEGLVVAYGKLAPELRSAHQLAVVCSAHENDRARLLQLATEQGLSDGDLVLTGYVPDDDLLSLYNLCSVFVFPSWHEGFGLPALEAMACGRAVIASDCSSLPEVVGRPDALFDPHDPQSIADKLTQVLTDGVFRAALEKHGIEQAAKFGWDKSAALAIQAIERCVESAETESRSTPSIRGGTHRPRLAYVSPLPPERTGIADYSAELLPELASFYEIVVIVPREVAATPWIQYHCPQRDVAWFREHASCFDRVIYHFGNSSFHWHMFSLLKEIPGTVVLHDFFLSGAISSSELQCQEKNAWSRALYTSHGYHAVQHRFHAVNPDEVIWEYPCNFDVLQHAQGVIVHSDVSRRLGRQWYGSLADLEWQHIPHLRTSIRISEASKKSARKQLGLKADDFVVCSFGLLGPTKLNHRLLNAWLNSPLANDQSCILVFVGENHAGDYGAALTSRIMESGCQDRIKITGWADAELFQQYLSAADVGVQLRSLSRGETSGTVLDCMNYGLAIIVNANGSMADLPDEPLLKLVDDFSDEALIAALVDLYRDVSRRTGLGALARQFLREHHSPLLCARAYRDAIEACRRRAHFDRRHLVARIADIDSRPNETQLINAARAISESTLFDVRQPQLLLDVSSLMQGTVDVAEMSYWKSFLLKMLAVKSSTCRVEPIYAKPGVSGFRYARRFVLDLLECQSDFLDDEAVDYGRGDLFFGLQIQMEGLFAQRNHFKLMSERGVDVRFAVFPSAENSHSGTTEPIVAGMAVSEVPLDDAHPSPDDIFLAKIVSGFSFFLEVDANVGDGFGELLKAFESLWRDGSTVNLVVLGQGSFDGIDVGPGFGDAHPSPQKHLFWRSGASDAFREKVLATCSCQLIINSDLWAPVKLMDAALNRLPLIVRDLPAVRHLGKDAIHYFGEFDASSIRRSLEEWMRLTGEGKIRAPNAIPWMTPGSKFAQLLDALDRGTSLINADDSETLQQLLFAKK